ncbi:MAG: hypothetical protein ACUZ8E_17400 [Candidatus Anammoxibacter sp.]
MRNIPTKVDNIDSLAADEFNKSIMEELENAVTKTGITLDPGAGPDTDSLMLARALTITAQGGAIYSDGGVADAYVLTAIGGFEKPVAYTDGMTVTFKVGNLNTGASTVDVAGIGAKAIVDSVGGALAGGELAADAYVTITFDDGNDRFELALGVTIVAASETVQGIIELATQVEVDAGTDTVRAITPATLAAAAGGGDSPLGGGYVSSRFYWGGQETSATGFAGKDVLYARVFSVNSDETFTRIGIDVNTAVGGSEGRFGIYEFSNGVPGALITDLGVISLATTGEKELVISNALSAGVFVLAVVLSDTGLNLDGGAYTAFMQSVLLGRTSLAAPNVQIQRAFTFGPLPDPFGAVTFGGGFQPIIWLRKV